MNAVLSVGEVLHLQKLLGRAYVEKDAKTIDLIGRVFEVNNAYAALLNKEIDRLQRIDDFSAECG